MCVSERSSPVAVIPPQVLHHPWLQSQTDAPAMEPVVLLRMREFARYTKFKKEALKVGACS